MMAFLGTSLEISAEKVLMFMVPLRGMLNYHDVLCGCFLSRPPQAEKKGYEILFVDVSVYLRSDHKFPTNPSRQWPRKLNERENPYDLGFGWRKIFSGNLICETSWVNYLVSERPYFMSRLR